MQLVTALVVLATEEGAEGGGGHSLILPPVSELIAGIVAFAIVFWFVGRRAMPMINRTLEARYQWERVLTLEADDEMKARVRAKIDAMPQPGPIVAAAIDPVNATQ